jgi:hypothetical protein
MLKDEINLYICKSTSSIGTGVSGEHEINQLIARNGGELGLFEQMDVERRCRERCC